MNSKVAGIASEERLKIQEKALSNMSDAIRKYESEVAEELSDIRSELKAIKLFLARNNPEFKKEFPEIQRKVK